MYTYLHTEHGRT